MNFVLVLTTIFLLSSCANRYMIAGNRFVSPETLGKRYSFQVGTIAGDGTNVYLDAKDGKEDNPVSYESLPRFKYMLEGGLGQKFDYYFSQTSGSLGMHNLKWQFLGNPKKSRSHGNKMALSVGYGTGKNKIDDDPDVEFSLNANDISLIHGYRWYRGILFYESLSYTKYGFSSELTSKDQTLDGLSINNSTTVIGLHGGIELAWKHISIKGELGYQKLSTSNTETKTVFNVGYGISAEF